MRNTNAMDKLKSFVIEFNTMCETIEKETKHIEDRIEEIKEMNYFDFCTMLEEYRWLVIDEIKTTVTVKTNFTNNELKSCSIMFCSDGCVYLGYEDRCHARLAFNQSDFYPIYNHSAWLQKQLFELTKGIDWDMFEVEFIKEIEKVITEEAKEVNKKREAAEKDLDRMRK